MSASVDGRGEREKYFPRVGSVRPSHLLYSAGVGAVVDLPSISVLVRGLDTWDYSRVVPVAIQEERLLANVRRVLGPQVAELREPPIPEDEGYAGTGQSDRVGVPVVPFPQWLRCTACDRLGRLDEGSLWKFVNRVRSRPDLARFAHAQCPSRRNDPIAVPARFVLACPAGHLDEFPWVSFVHRNKPCPEGSGGRLSMEDKAGNIGPNVIVKCECGARRNMLQSVGPDAAGRLPRCRGRHPHLGLFDSECPRANEVRTLVLGASNQWFAVGLSALHLPSRSHGLAAEIERLWSILREVRSEDQLDLALRMMGELVGLRPHGTTAVWKAIDQYRRAVDAGALAGGPTDLRVAEYEALTDQSGSVDQEDFTIRTVRVADAATSLVEQVVLVERLKVARAFVGFTRLDAPEWNQALPETMVRLSNLEPTWVPATQTRGEGIFIRLREDVLTEWEKHADVHPHVEALEAAYGRFRLNRKREPTGWPGARYLLLHTLSHMLIRQMSLECGYSSASLAERIYHDLDGRPAAGILIYTAAPDSEGTLGGLVSLGEPDRFGGLFRDAVDEARWCSSDPLCAEREPVDPEDFVHGAACHACLFLSETTCERGNRFLDRSLVVPLDPRPELAILPSA
jgi:hypothetical protein